MQLYKLNVYDYNLFIDKSKFYSLEVICRLQAENSHYNSVQTVFISMNLKIENMYIHTHIYIYTIYNNNIFNCLI